MAPARRANSDCGLLLPSADVGRLAMVWVLNAGHNQQRQIEVVFSLTEQRQSEVVFSLTEQKQSEVVFSLTEQMQFEVVFSLTVKSHPPTCIYAHSCTHTHAEFSELSQN